MSFEIEGALHKKFDTENKTDTFQAREFVIKTDGQYPQFVKFQLTQDRCQVIDSYNEGDMIKVHFDLRGREWNEKYFTNLNAWRVEKHATAEATAVNSAPAENASFPDPSNMPSKESSSTQGNEDFDDLPF